MCVFLERGAELILLGALQVYRFCSSSHKPPGSKGEWVGLGTQAWGWGWEALGCKQEVLAAQKRRSSLAATTDSWGRGQKSREYKHPCGSGVLGRAGERAGAKLSRKETHISHVSLAGPTAGAL